MVVSFGFGSFLTSIEHRKDCCCCCCLTGSPLFCFVFVFAFVFVLFVLVLVLFACSWWQFLALVKDSTKISTELGAQVEASVARGDRKLARKISSNIRDEVTRKRFLSDLDESGTTPQVGSAT